MKHSMMFSAVLFALALSACDRPTVVIPAPVVAVPPPTVVTPAPVAVPVPGPAGPPGAQGAPGEPGKPGDTVVVIPPAEPQQR
jgi:hypothetical protein